jgi:hypothetical protein
MRGIVNSTKDFEAWARNRTDLSDKLLSRSMAKWLMERFHPTGDVLSLGCGRTFVLTLQGEMAMLRCGRSARGELRHLAGLA